MKTSQKPVSPKNSPTHQELRNAWLRVESCMWQTFSFYLWQKHFKPNDGDSDTSELQHECRLVQTAVLSAAVLNIRAIDDFFRIIGKEREGDIKASHYPRFLNPGPFLSSDEAKALNKSVIHLDYIRVRGPLLVVRTYSLISRAYVKF